MDCDAWRKDKKTNPKTNRKIRVGGPTYDRIKLQCAFNKSDCDAWKKDPLKNPTTGRKLNANAKNGLYAQLSKLCSVIKTPGRPPSRSSAAIDPASSVERRRAILRSAIRKAISPILNRGDSTRVRIEYARIVRRYIDKLKPCLEKRDGSLCLVDDGDLPVVRFDRRIGTESNYGIAYANTGKGFAKLLKFSCKIMSSGVSKHDVEVKLLDKMSRAAEKGQSPNMPVTYRTIECKRPCMLKDCPDVAKLSRYYVVINELASYDLHAFFQKKRTQAEYESVWIQIAFAIRFFHTLGYDHNDCHLGNFLIHEIRRGGCWRYRILGRDVYIPNEGFLVVLWDPAFAKKTGSNFRQDYGRVFDLITRMNDYKVYRDKKMIPMPDRFVDESAIPFADKITYSFGSEEETIASAIDAIKNGDYGFRSIVVDDRPPTHLLNVKPFLLDARSRRR